MFGLNDNNPKPADNNAAGTMPAEETPAVMPGNPFNDTYDSLAQGSVPPAAPAAVAPAMPAVSEPPVAPSPDPGGSNDDLLDLKGQALKNLQPLVSHLDQSPEEKFKTTMMLIQATDNSALVKDAYEAANQIPDEKARAQALLDVVNEINYFTQHHNGGEPAA